MTTMDSARTSMNEAAVVALAKRQLGFLSYHTVSAILRAPVVFSWHFASNGAVHYVNKDIIVPKAYLDELRSHISIYPHDTNVRREFISLWIYVQCVINS